MEENYRKSNTFFKKLLRTNVSMFTPSASATPSATATEMSIATSSAGPIVKPSVAPIGTPSASPIDTPSATEMSIASPLASLIATPSALPLVTPSSTTFIAIPTEMSSLPYFTQRSTNSNDSWETVISKNSDSCFDINTSGQRLKSTKVQSDSNSDLGDSSDIKDLKVSEVSKDSINESSDSDDSHNSSNSWETNSSNTFAAWIEQNMPQRIRQNKSKPKEEVKVMTMVYIWDQNKVVSGMRKRQSDTSKSFKIKLYFHIHSIHPRISEYMDRTLKLPNT